jgi:hypothetical protein
MSLRVCTVAFRAATGISHSVEVHAETLMEAAGYGFALLKKDGWIEGLGPGTRLEIGVREPSTQHVVSVEQLQRWINGTQGAPAEALRRAKVKKMLT